MPCAMRLTERRVTRRCQSRVKQGAVLLQAGNLAQGSPDSVKIVTPQAKVKGTARQFLVSVEEKT